MKRLRFLLGSQVKWLLATGLIQFLSVAASAADVTAFVGTYTGPQSKGIYSLRFDADSGKLSTPTLAAESANPSFLAIHPNRRYVYAANEIDSFQGKAAGSISAFAIEGNSLKLINSVSSRGAGPCHVATDRTGHWLFAANYAGGSVAAFPIQPNGALGEASSFFQHSLTSIDPRQREPHAHVVVPSPDNRFC